MALPASADIPFSRSQISYSFAPLVKTAAPAVVNIYASRRVQQQVNPMFDDPFVRRFFGGNIPGGQMAERVQKSLGSGVIVRGDGLIVTNAHVISDADEIRVVLSDRREFPAKVALKDEHADLAVLRIDVGGETLPHLTLADSDQAEVGDLVLAIGNPFGVGQTVTNGIVSAMGRSAEGLSEFNEFIQTDAPINPGNSGGALLNMDGQLLGINAAIYSRDGGSLGIGFAIPANIVRTVIEAAESGQKPVRPWIGMNGQAVTADLATSLGLKKPEGLLVDTVTAGSPAAQAGLHQGDVVLSLGGREITDTPSLRARLTTLKVGVPVPIILFRNGNTVTLNITPAAPAEIPPREATLMKGREPFTGATVENLSPAVTEELGMANVSTGVIVATVADNTTAAAIGLQPGDIILGVNGVKIDAVKTLLEKTAKPVQQWRLAIQRGGQVINTVING